ncbi:hypothetical protein IUJ34_26995 (plasmid) [Klebsiella pneumoniae subsp. pneumoniae]|uniref:Uncharacterized protein n=1 Tax=Klebsiella pneumoniae subsp. pneumoniae TaxID=72407 RepID=A0A7S9HFR3_KLEPN|nr:hypothetical protein IUJ34_26995 [Klebsiella pneumoniae subsp. pneumoniae]
MAASNRRFKITQGIVDRGFFRPFLQINQSSPFGTVWYVTDWHLRNVTDSSKVQIPSTPRRKRLIR